MLSHNQQKLLRKLQLRKHRWQQQLFIAEGRKVVSDLLESGLRCHFLASNNEGHWPQAVQISSVELANISQLEKTDEVVGVFHFPRFGSNLNTPLTLILDEIRDPGNLGTIIRTADWYGVREIFCVNGTVDAYNTKCVQSSMGSIGRVKINFGSREEIAATIPDKSNLLVADMEGKSLYDQIPAVGAWLVMGSESHGPSPFWNGVAQPVTIPRKGQSTESLNVAIATAVMLDRLTP